MFRRHVYSSITVFDEKCNLKIGLVELTTKIILSEKHENHVEGKVKNIKNTFFTE